MIEEPPLDLQLAIEADGWPEDAVLRGKVLDAVTGAFDELELQPSPLTCLSLLFTDDETIRRLNAEWRGFDKPTNVLSFPGSETAESTELPGALGDIAFALETISNEARMENKPFDHHLTHLIVHGLLHLLGYDHQTDEEAVEMETVETRILARLAIPDPYGMMIGND